jgi:hypothetical protein
MSDKASKTSVILKEVIAACEQEGTITVGEFLKMLGDKSFCLAILVFSLPNSLPVPGIPGFSTLTGLPITFIGVQMMLGRPALWLPYRFANKSFSKQGVGKMLAKALPTVIWLEKFLKPRWLPLTSRFGERVLGAFFVVLSLVIALPIPGGNFLPGVSMSLLALGMIERDGVFLTGAMLFSVATVVFMYEVIRTFFRWIGREFSKVF